MLDYTRTLLNKTVKDVTYAFNIFHFTTQAVYIAYLTYMLIRPNNIWYLHLSLFIISLAFLIYDIIVSKMIRNLKNERPKRSAKKAHRQRILKFRLDRAKYQKIKFYASHVLKLFVLASAFYPIVVYPETVHPLSIICTTVMALLWILLVIFEIVKLMFEAKKDMFMEALQADFEFVTKPINKIKDKFSFITGKETEEKEKPTQNRIYLDELVKVAKEEKAQKKAEVKAERKEKLSAWLDGHLSKLHKKKKLDSKEAQPINTEESEETESVTTENV